jgi:hypothetical protein
MDNGRNDAPLKKGGVVVERGIRRDGESIHAVGWTPKQRAPM